MIIIYLGETNPNPNRNSNPNPNQNQKEWKSLRGNFKLLHSNQQG